MTILENAFIIRNILHNFDQLPMQEIILNDEKRKILEGFETIKNQKTRETLILI